MRILLSTDIKAECLIPNVEFNSILWHPSLREGIRGVRLKILPSIFKSQS